MSVWQHLSKILHGVNVTRDMSCTQVLLTSPCEPVGYVGWLGHSVLRQGSRCPRCASSSSTTLQCLRGISVSSVNGDGEGSNECGTIQKNFWRRQHLTGFE